MSRCSHCNYFWVEEGDDYGKCHYKSLGLFDPAPCEIEEDLGLCQRCGKRFPREEMQFSYDCHGIPFRFLCPSCYDKAMAKGYDGQYYTEADECIDWDY